MSKIRLSAVEVRWCKLQAMRDSVYLHQNKSRNPIQTIELQSIKGVVQLFDQTGQS